MWTRGAGTELNRAINRAFADAPAVPAQNRASFEVPFEAPEAHGAMKAHSRAAGSARTILASAHLAAAAPAPSQPALLSPTHASRPPLPSGPHHQRQQPASGTACSAEDHAAAYEQWRAQHPCVLQRLSEVQSRLAGKRLAIFLDYDGTLTPIVANPDEAILSQQMRDVVRSVAQLFPTAIISGRGREKVENFVQLKELYYAGSHGMDIAGPLELRGGGNMAPADMAFQPAAHFRPLIDAVYQELLERLAPIPGSSVEHNTFCVSAHFRNCSAERWQEVVQVAEDVVAHNPELRMTRGRKVVELRPKVNWHKGTALDHLLGVLGLRECADVVAIYIGDDHTDEDAFKVLRDTQQGFGVLVSSKVRDTAATYTARDPTDVQVFLQSLVAWGATERNGWQHYHQQGRNGTLPPTGGASDNPTDGSDAPADGSSDGAAASQQQQQPSQQPHQGQHSAQGDGGGGGGGAGGLAGTWHAAQQQQQPAQGAPLLSANNHGLLSLVGSPQQQQPTPISG